MIKRFNRDYAHKKTVRKKIRVDEIRMFFQLNTRTQKEKMIILLQIEMKERKKSLRKQDIMLFI